jgi:Fic family protein
MSERSDFQPKFTITNTITSALTKIERARGFLDAAKLSADWIAEMQHRALVLEAHHTTHIEGTRLTLEQSEQLLAGKSVPDADPDDARELLNYREAFDLVAGYLGNGLPITEGLIREIHRRLVTGVRGDRAMPGEYRRAQNYVVNAQGQVVYTPPPAHEVPHLMRDIVKWLGKKQEINAVLIAGIAQFQLVHIHPFLDGNGRTARLLSTLCLYRSGYDFKRLFTISEYYDRDRAAYYKAIQSVREREMDLSVWLEYFTEGLATQMREVQERGEQVIRRDVILAKARKAGLKDRPLAILAFLLERSKGTIAECEDALKTNRRTLQRDLKLLVDKGFLREVSTGPTDPTKYYEPVL